MNEFWFLGVVTGILMTNTTWLLIRSLFINTNVMEFTLGLLLLILSFMSLSISFYHLD